MAETISILRPDFSMQQVSCLWKSRYFGIHDTMFDGDDPDIRFTLTHLPTGRAALCSDDLPTLIEAGKRLESVPVDWDIHSTDAVPKAAWDAAVSLVLGSQHLWVVRHS